LRTRLHKKVKISLALSLMTLVIEAQQLPVFTQYIFNKYIFNPAVTGTEDNFSATANYRYQWQGITDAPRTYIMSVHGPHKFKSFGLGGSLYTDVTGPTSKTGMYLSYAYHSQMNKETKLSLGLSGGVMQYRVDGTKVNLADPGDLTLPNSPMTRMVPDFGFGAYLYGKKFFCGLSVPQFIQAKLDFSDDGTQTLSNLTSHFYFNTGYTFKVNQEFSVEPSMMMRYGYPVIPQFDFAAKGIYKENYFIGVMGRTQNGLSVLLGFQSTNGKFNFGYAYDVNTVGLASYSTGSHELMMKATFGKIKQRRPSGARKRKKKISRLEKLEQKLQNLEKEEGESFDSKEGGMNHYNDSNQNKTSERFIEEIEYEKSLEQRLEEVEAKDRELRAKVRALRNEAEEEGYSSPNDSEFPKRSEYIKALDQIKEIYRKKKELDALID
tara:strand:- start:673 stop:1983 length:1311 start_codon:yes stop_codon:yes gene_type:complete